MNNLAKGLGTVRVASDYRDVLDEVDVALVATPHPTHAAIVTACLEAGKHVLCEKPLCVTAAECRGLMAAAAKSGKVLAVGLMRRQSPAYRMASDILQRQELGRPLRFTFREGGPLNWPIRSAGFWSQHVVRGGVLLDTGPHTLDLLTWWLGDWDRVTYEDDCLGNVEADVWLRVTMKSGAERQVVLSRTHDPGQFYRVECERKGLERGRLRIRRTRRSACWRLYYSERWRSPLRRRLGRMATRQAGPPGDGPAEGSRRRRGR